MMIVLPHSKLKRRKIGRGRLILKKILLLRIMCLLSPKTAPSLCS